MTGFIDELLAEVIGQQVALMSTVARLEARTDGEALHDLRIALRRLRSLLRPIRGVPGVEELEHAAAEVGRLSGPIRDLEVLLPALAAEGLRDALAVRRPVLESGYVAVLASQPLHRLQLCLDVWPALLRTAQRHAVLDGLHGRVRKRLRRQWKTLRAELADTTYEHWHPLRLRIKRVRYGLEAYPHDCSIPGSLLAPLKAAQSALGDWHDLEQWLLRCQREPDLAPVREVWTARLRTGPGACRTGPVDIAAGACRALRPPVFRSAFSQGSPRLRWALESPREAHMNFSELIQAVRRDPSSVVVPASWGQGRATFGGLVVALAYEAMLAVVEAGRPLRSIGVSFVGPLAPEQPASFSARLLREGKAVSQVQVEVRQGEQVVTLVQASFGVARASAVAVEALPAAGMKGPEESQELPYIRNVTPEFTRYIAMRWAVGGLPFSSNKSRQMGGWMRFRDEPEGEPMEVSHLLALLDSWPPALLPHLGTPAMASSLTWTAEFLQPLPQQGSGDWCRYLAEIEEARDGYGHVAARMWSADGQLLAISRQMVTVFG